MVRPEAKIRYLEFELDEKERLIRMMENAGSGAGEDRVAALEKKVNEMEALVKGLTQELLDLKSIAMKMSKMTEERSRQELKRMQPIRSGIAGARCRFRCIGPRRRVAALSSSAAVPVPLKPNRQPRPSPRWT